LATTGGILGEWQLSLSSKGDVFPGAVLGTGGSINVITRSGANVLHGDAFSFLQNGRLSGRDPFLTEPEAG